MPTIYIHHLELVGAPESLADFEADATAWTCAPWSDMFSQTQVAGDAASGHLGYRFESDWKRLAPSIAEMAEKHPGLEVTHESCDEFGEAGTRQRFLKGALVDDTRADPDDFAWLEREEEAETVDWRPLTSVGSDEKAQPLDARVVAGHAELLWFEVDSARRAGVTFDEQSSAAVVFAAIVAKVGEAGQAACSAATRDDATARDQFVKMLIAAGAVSVRAAGWFEARVEGISVDEAERDTMARACANAQVMEDHSDVGPAPAEWLFGISGQLGAAHAAVLAAYRGVLPDELKDDSEVLGHHAVVELEWVAASCLQAITALHPDGLPPPRSDG